MIRYFYNLIHFRSIINDLIIENNKFKKENKNLKKENLLLRKKYYKHIFITNNKNKFEVGQIVNKGTILRKKVGDNLLQNIIALSAKLLMSYLSRTNLNIKNIDKITTEMYWKYEILNINSKEKIKWYKESNLTKIK